MWRYYPVQSGVGVCADLAHAQVILARQHADMRLQCRPHLATRRIGWQRASGDLTTASAAAMEQLVLGNLQRLLGQLEHLMAEAGMGIGLHRAAQAGAGSCRVACHHRIDLVAQASSMSGVSRPSAWRISATRRLSFSFGPVSGAVLGRRLGGVTRTGGQAVLVLAQLAPEFLDQGLRFVEIPHLRRFGGKGFLLFHGRQTARKRDQTSDLGDRGMLITFFCQPGAGERLLFGDF
jgi:hypothetical protein